MSIGTASRSLSTLFDSEMFAEADADVDADADARDGDGDGDVDDCVCWVGGGEETDVDDKGVVGDVNGENGDPM